MIDLRNKYVLVRTQEEYAKILEEAEKQGFKWCGRNNLKPIPAVLNFFSILKFSFDRTVRLETGDFLAASELLGTKEMTATKFVENIERICNCRGRKCQDCVFNFKNTKCGKTLCSFANWAGCKDELISIAKSGRTTISSQNEMILESFRDFLDSPAGYPTITSDFIESVQFVVDKLKEQEK